MLDGCPIAQMRKLYTDADARQKALSNSNRFGGLLWWLGGCSLRQLIQLLPVSNPQVHQLPTLAFGGKSAYFQIWQL